MQIYFNCDVVLQNFSQINDLKETTSIAVNRWNENTLASGSIQTKNIEFNQKLIFCYNWRKQGYPPEIISKISKIRKTQGSQFGPSSSFGRFRGVSYTLHIQLLGSRRGPLPLWLLRTWALEDVFFGVKNPGVTGKLLVPLGWYPSCLTLQGALQKGIYPINTHDKVYMGLMEGWKDLTQKFL